MAIALCLLFRKTGSSGQVAWPLAAAALAVSFIQQKAWLYHALPLLEFLWLPAGVRRVGLTLGSPLVSFR